MIRFIFAGFGGQGVLFMGKVTAQAGMEEGKQVTWIPAYGPEMRGGTANCSVIVADRKIGSPTVANPDVAVVMNLSSYHKFLNSVVPGGILYVNSSIIPDLPGRDDIHILRVPVNDLAHELGNDGAGNIVMLGAIQALTPHLTDAAIQTALKELGGKKPELAKTNEQALQAGYRFGKEMAGK